MTKKSFIKVQDGVHVVKSRLFRYRLIFPIQKDINKSFWEKDNKNWFNLVTGGSYGNLLMVALVATLMVVLVLTYRHDIMAAVECCNSACQNLVKTLPQTKNSMSWVNITELISNFNKS